MRKRNYIIYQQVISASATGKKKPSNNDKDKLMGTGGLALLEVSVEVVFMCRVDRVSSQTYRYLMEEYPRLGE